MADLDVTFHPDHAAIAALSSRSGMVGRAVVNAATTAVQRARQNVTRYGRVRTGAMRDGIRLGRFTGGDQVVQQLVGTVDYTIYQHQGTRRGIRPAPFLLDAANSLRPGDFRAT